MKSLSDESGYSLVELMVAILILSVAIIPMVGMFDAALRTTTTSSSYDSARMLANSQLEEVKSLPYDSTSSRDAKDNFPEAMGTTTTYSSGSYRSDWKSRSGMEYRVTKRFLTPPSDSASQSFTVSGSERGLIRVVVEVRWGSSNSYTVTGMVSE